MAVPAPLSAAPRLAADTQGLSSLRGAAARDPKAQLQATARQFEALFMQEVMKSMRAATASSGMLDNSGTQLGTDMLDQQFAAQMTGLKGGLSEAITRQLQRQLGLPTDPVSAPPVGTAPRRAEPLPPLAVKGVAPHVQRFIQQHDAAAREAEAATGIPASFMIAQAAHESGWGRQDIRNADGTPSHNLFGIKATGGWKGKVAEIMTTEYINGQPRKVMAKFRAYDTPADAFKDYARLIGTNSRYRDVVANAQSAEGFAQGLQRAGYATDPAYAQKLARVINTTVRVQRAMA